jgi:hypothetical protein
LDGGALGDDFTEHKTIAELNIKHSRRLLVAEMDETERGTIAYLTRYRLIRASTIADGQCLPPTAAIDCKSA